MEWNTHSNGFDVDVHVGKDENRIKVLVAVTNTLDCVSYLTSPMGSWCTARIINMEHMVNVLESEFSAAAVTDWRIEPGKTLVRRFETITPEEAKESVEGLRVETTTDITEDEKTNAYIPNVCLQDETDTKFSLSVSLKLDNISINKDMNIEFKLQELSDIKNIENRYTIQKSYSTE